MKSSKILQVLIAIAVGMMAPRRADAQFRIPVQLVASGGGQAASSAQRVIGTVGQPILTRAQNATNRINAGFWQQTPQVQFAPPPATWNFVSNTGGNAIIAVPAAIHPTIGAEPLETGDAIGLFFVRNDSLIGAGFGIWHTGQNLSITAWADNSQTAMKDGFADGEVIFYKIWDESTRREFTAIATYRGGGTTFVTNEIYELSSLAGSLADTHMLPLAQGWNTISSFVDPNDPALETLLSAIIPRMMIMKNGLGQVFWPAFGINSIGQWNFRHGYQVFMQSRATLSIIGTPVKPELMPISLAVGWNLVAYLRSSPQSPETALAGILNQLVIVKNNAGQVFWPQFNINTIGSLQPGQGYEINVRQAVALTYPVNTPSPLQKPDMMAHSDVNTTQHYAPVPNSGVNAIVMVDAATLTDRDEIAVVDKSGRIAGAGVVQRGKALLAIWGDNPVTAEIIEGAVEGEELTLNVWRNAEQTEMSLALLSLTDGITGESLGPNLRYQQNAVWIATVTLSELLPTDFTLEQNYPNPFNPSTVIRYGLPNEAEVELAVYNVLGQQIARLVDEKQKAGYHEVVFHREALTSGMYFYRLRAGAFIRTKKMLILR